MVKIDTGISVNSKTRKIAIKPPKNVPYGTSRRNLIAKEADEQKALVKWANLQNIQLVHIPNEGLRSLRYGAQLKAMGMSRGFPDLFMPRGFGGFFGLFIEMKQNRSYSDNEKNKESWKNQEAWIERLIDSGYYAKIVFGCDEGIELIKMYTGLPKTRICYG